MILLDTDVLSVLRFADHPRAIALRDPLRSSRDRRIAVSVISLEEQVRGWLTLITRAKNALGQV
jgi:hypothetical protein